jgi:glutamine synthetase
VLYRFNGYPESREGDAMFTSTQEALDYISKHEVAMIDLKIVGAAGQWFHITIPARRFSQAHFEKGIGYDGSSGSGFGTVESGDVAARPDPATAFIDPFFEKPTLSFICSTITADTKELLPSDPRTIAGRAAAYMRSTGIADEALMAPEYEFHLFDRVRVQNDPYRIRVDIQSTEVQTRGTTPPITARRGYLRTPPAEKSHDIRSEISLLLADMGVPVHYHHHEVGAPGQCEIEVDRVPLVTAADQAMLVKYVVKNVARRHGKIATFMPKPVFGEAGNGMHVHQKLDRAGRPLFFAAGANRYADLSDVALQYIGGLLAHGPSLTALTNPSTNSFKRLVPGFEAPVNLFFSLANRSAAIRVPRYAVSPEEKRIEYRPPDSTCNVYLALAAMLMAGLDGIETKIDVAKHDFGPFDVDIAKQDAEFMSRLKPLPRSLYDALDALQRDHHFLSKSEVFPQAFIDNWIVARRQEEATGASRRPHPYEYELYLDA